MVSPQASDKFLANHKITQYDHDPDGTSATDVAWVDMRDFEEVVMSFFRSVGTGTIAYSILANAESDGSGTDVTIKTGAATPDAIGDYAFLSCLAEEIAQEGADNSVTGLRYVSLSVTFGTGTDEGVVTYVRTNAKHPSDGLTADSIA